MRIDSPEQVWRQWQPMMRSVALRILGNADDAEDCVQDAMVLVVERWDQVRPETASSWVHTIVRNQALTLLRLRRRRRYSFHVPIEEMENHPACRSLEEPILARLLIEQGAARLGRRKAAAVRLRAAGAASQEIEGEFCRSLQFRALAEMRAVLSGLPVRAARA